MLDSFTGAETFVGEILQQSGYQIEEQILLVRFPHLIPLQIVAVLPHVLPFTRSVVPLNTTPVEVFLLASRLNHSARKWTKDAFHHGEVFSVVVGLEESVAAIQFEDDRTYAPHVAWVGPPKLQQHL